LIALNTTRLRLPPAAAILAVSGSGYLDQEKSLNGRMRSRANLGCRKLPQSAYTALQVSAAGMAVVEVVKDIGDAPTLRKQFQSFLPALFGDDEDDPRLV
jgi:hypothetical protein